MHNALFHLNLVNILHVHFQKFGFSVEFYDKNLLLYDVDEEKYRQQQHSEENSN